MRWFKLHRILKWHSRWPSRYPEQARWVKLETTAKALRLQSRAAAQPQPDATPVLAEAWAHRLTPPILWKNIAHTSSADSPWSWSRAASTSPLAPEPPPFLILAPPA